VKPTRQTKGKVTDSLARSKRSAILGVKKVLLWRNERKVERAKEEDNSRKDLRTKVFDSDHDCEETRSNTALVTMITTTMICGGVGYT
jgi:hypothetical protein